MGGYVRKESSKSNDRIEALERKVVELQAKGIEYKGAWQRACSYERGAIVTFEGSMWVCVENVEPNTRPGQSQGWQLLLPSWPRRKGRKGGCMNEPQRDDKTFYAPTLTKAEVRFSIVDEYILLRLDTADDQTWWRLTRANFIGLAKYLNDEAQPDQGALTDGD